MIHKLFKSSLTHSTTYFRLSINNSILNPIHIFYSHKYITATTNSNIKLVHGKIFGFSIGEHSYIDDKYYKSDKAKTVTSMKSAILINKIDTIQKQHTNQNTTKNQTITKNQTDKINQDINKYINLSLLMTSMYIYNDDLYIDPSMQLLDLIDRYIKYKMSCRTIFDYNIESILEDIENYRNNLINELYDNIPKDSIPLIIDDIEELEE